MEDCDATVIEWVECNVDGEHVSCVELGTAKLKVRCLTLGCYIASMSCPDKDGVWKDVVLGFDLPEDFKGYMDGRCAYFGCCCGRVANRIKEGKFSLDGQEYTLAVNNGPNALHGGLKGWDKKNWKIEDCDVAESGPFVRFGLLSPDGEEGYPGEVKASVTYALHDGQLLITYTATTTKPTVLNVTNHSYFNLSGDFSKQVLDHQLSINAERFTVVDSVAIPTGELRPVEGTPFDFRTLRRIGDKIDENEEQVKFGKGYDHNFVLTPASDGADLQLCAVVEEPTTGRCMTVKTTEPGVQLYTGNFLDPASGKGRGGVPLGHRTGFCLETQHFPDSPNRPEFPSVVLKPGETFHSSTSYEFYCK